MASSPSLSDLAALVLRRREELRLGRRQAARAGEMSPMTWNNVEDGKQAQTLTYAGIEKALLWPSGSIRRYLETGEAPSPMPAENDEGPGIRVATHQQLLDELRRRHEEMRSELSRRLGPALSAAGRTETAESVSDRGMIPLRPLGGEESDDAAGAGRP